MRIKKEKPTFPATSVNSKPSPLDTEMTESSEGSLPQEPATQFIKEEQIEEEDADGNQVKSEWGSESPSKSVLQRFLIEVVKNDLPEEEDEEMSDQCADKNGLKGPLRSNASEATKHITSDVQPIYHVEFEQIKTEKPDDETARESISFNGELDLAEDTSVWRRKRRGRGRKRGLGAGWVSLKASTTPKKPRAPHTPIPVPERELRPRPYPRPEAPLRSASRKPSTPPLPRVPTLYSCSHCEKRFIMMRSLREHLKRDHHVGSYVCKVCGQVFFHHSSLSHHKRYHEVGEIKPNPRHSCNICERKFGLLSTLLEHFKKEHVDAKPFTCPFCGDKFKCYKSLLSHKRNQHTVVKPHVCTFCSKCFRGSDKLKLHIRSHTGERPYLCDRCGDTFARTSYLIDHMRRHTGERPFICDVCDKAFTQRPALNTHKRTHSQEKAKKRRRRRVQEDEEEEDDEQMEKDEEDGEEEEKDEEEGEVEGHVIDEQEEKEEEDAEEDEGKGVKVQKGRKNKNKKEKVEEDASEKEKGKEKEVEKEEKDLEEAKEKSASSEKEQLFLT